MKIFYKDRRSLAQRLTRALVACVSVVWVACTLAVVWHVNREINRNFDQELHESAVRMFDVALHALNAVPASIGTLVSPQPEMDDADPVVFQLVNSDGRVLMRSLAAPSLRFAVPLSSGFSQVPGWRVYTAHHAGKNLYLHMADYAKERRLARNRTLVGLALGMVIALPLLALLLVVIAQRELALLHRLETQIAVRNSADLQPISLEGMPQELYSVGEHVNRLLARLGHALQVERALAANAAHELRTPLAAVRLRLQTALDAGLRRNDVQAALDSLKALSHRTEKLLQLSRAESTDASGENTVDLEQLAALVAQEFWSLPSARERLALKLPEGSEAIALEYARGDIDALAIALRNLVENALRYGGTKPVTIAVSAPCTLTVRDHGPGVPPERLMHLRQRHVRDSADHAGYGLGLSIVATIMEKQGGALQLLSPLPDGSSGLEARMVLVRAG